MRHPIPFIALLALLNLNAFADEPASPSAPVTQEKPDATVRLSGGTIAAGIGYVWATGELTYGGQVHRFRISGVSVADAGVAKLSGFGAVYRLKNLSDVDGAYFATSEGLAVISGSSGLYLKNNRGVVIKLLAADKGVRFNLGVDGVRLVLDN